MFYAQDAFEGLRLMEELRKGPHTASPHSGIEDAAASDEATADEGAPFRVGSHRVGVVDPELFVFDGSRSEVGPATEIPEIPFYGVRKAEKFDVFEVFKYINTIALFRGHGSSGGAKAKETSNSTTGSKNTRGRSLSGSSANWPS